MYVPIVVDRNLLWKWKLLKTLVGKKQKSHWHLVTMQWIKIVSTTIYNFWLESVLNCLCANSNSSFSKDNFVIYVLFWKY